MGQLIDDMLSLARVSRVELKREAVDLSVESRRIIAHLRDNPQAASRNVEIEVADGMVTQGDRGLLRILLENLLGNAWKFTSKCERASIIFDRQPAEDGPAVFFVRDNGAGFDKKYADKLFGVFQRLHSVEEFPGTGVGLATVARVVRRHGGRAWAEGAVGQGATFFFTLSET